MYLNYEQLEVYKDEVNEWANKTTEKIKSKIGELNIQRSKFSNDPISLKDSIKPKVYCDHFRKPYEIGFKMNKTGVYIAKGINKWHPKTNPYDGKDWFDSVLEENIAELEKIVTRNTGAMIVNALKIH